MSNMNTLFSTGNKKDVKRDPKDVNFYQGNGLAYDDPGQAAGGSNKFDAVVEKAKSQGARGDDPQRPDDVTDVKIILWKNGFQVGDDGEFRDIEDPKNTKFVEELTQGVVPTELRNQYKKGCSVGLEDRRQRAYRPPTPPKYVSFSGQGASLGGQAAAQQSTGGAVNTSDASGKPKVDESKPKTAIQFRFHNGQRATLEVNTSHTIGDLHAYVMSVAPVDGTYTLISGFPPKPISQDTSQTIEEAKLLKAAITQKLS